MNEIEVVLLLLVAVTVLASVARRIGLPYPIVLVVGGSALAFIPGLPHVELEPEIVFLLFLPPLLFVSAFFTSTRDLKKNARPIGLLSIGLVIFTTLVVGGVAHTLLPELGWPVAFALGAIVSPTDAVAAAAIFRRLGVPRRIVNVLEGESLVNDSTGLIVYRAAVAAAVTGSFSLAEWGLRFFFVALGGVAFGLLVGWCVAQLWRRVQDPVTSITISLLAPYAAYLPAEHLGVSGVLASVMAGLYVSWAWARALAGEAASETRLKGRAVWETFEFVLNGLVFVLIGLQLPTIVSHLDKPLGEMVAIGLLIGLATIATRFIWVFPSVYIPRWISPSLRERDPAPPWQWSVVLGWSGMRGVVSLAAALALPRTIEGGTPLPGRDLVIFFTFCVILLTLVGQTLTLPWLIRRLDLGVDGSAEKEETLARALAAEAAVARIDQLEQEWPGHRDLVDQLRTRYEHRARHGPGADGHIDDDHSDDDGRHDDVAHERELYEHKEIVRAVIDAEREALVALHDANTITDEVLYTVLSDVDRAEVQMEA